MNERGQVLAGGLSYAYLWEDGQATLLNSPGQLLTPNDVSNQGVVVGTTTMYPFVDIPLGAFLWRNGQSVPLDTWWDDLHGSYFATSVNDRGQMLMWFIDSGRARRLAVWEAGEMTLTPDGTSFADGQVDSPAWHSLINEAGQAAFNMEVDGSSHAAIWDSTTGQVTDLGTLGGDISTFHDINGLGMVTGTSTTAAGEEHAFLWHDGEMTDLGTLGGETSTPTDLNEWGQVVGTSTTAEGEEHAFLWRDGEMTEIEPLGTPSTDPATIAPTAINNWGQVVGASRTDEGPREAFLWQNGRIVNLGAVVDGGGWSDAVDINDRGQIVGSVRLGAEGVLWTVPPLWGYTDDPASDLAAARRKWDENRPETYRVTVTQSCFCLPQVVEPRTVTVTGDVVESVEPPIPDDIGFEIEPLTVDALFDILERAVTEADELTVSYDEAYGFPESISIDWIEQAVDDEVSYSAQSFESLD